MEESNSCKKIRWYETAVWGGAAVVLAMILAFSMPGSYEPYRVPKERIPEAVKAISGDASRGPLTPEEQQAVQKIFAEHNIGDPEIRDVLRYAKSGWYWYLLAPFLIWLARYKVKKRKFSVLDFSLIFLPCLVALLLAIILV